ncbi:MAG: alkaline phosphatase family protein [Spirochaetia bacterium]
MIDTLLRAFESGVLSHPMQGETNSVELFRAMALLSGVKLFDETPTTERLSGLIGHHDHYLFVLVDGLGMNLRDRFPSGGFLESTLQHEIRSVFPSTTSVALTSLATGLWPAEHGLTGWWTHFPEHRRIIAPLIFTERGTRMAADKLGLSVEDLISGKPILGSSFRDPVSFLPKQISNGPYAAWSRDGTPIHPFRSHRQLARMIRRDAASLRGPSFRYLYLLTVDKLSHLFGITSDQVSADVNRIDQLLTRIRDMLPHTVRMIVTADHGLVDVPPERHFNLRDEDPVCAHLLGGQSGEGTTPVFHVRPGHDEAFLEEFSRTDAAAYYTLHTPDELAGLELYGPEPLSEAARAHLGQYVGIAVEPARLEYLPPGSERVNHVGVHGGLRPAEINIPLCVA